MLLSVLCDPLQGICLQLQVWRRGWQRAGWGQGGSSNLSTCPPPPWPPRPGSFTSSGTGRSTNELQRERLGLSKLWRILLSEIKRRGVPTHCGILLLSTSWRSLILPRRTGLNGFEGQMFSPLFAWLNDHPVRVMVIWGQEALALLGLLVVVRLHREYELLWRSSGMWSGTEKLKEVFLLLPGKRNTSLSQIQRMKRYGCQFCISQNYCRR